MSKWRPVELNCLYVIPDIHGAFKLLKNICKRILPLRKSDGGKDKLIILGDLIDRHNDSHLVLDYLIELKKKYKDQIIILRGNHEEMFLKAFNLYPNKNISLFDQATNYRVWMANGGYETMYGYLERAGVELNPSALEKHRYLDFIPKEHIEFLQHTLEDYYETDKYIFVHAGMEPGTSLANQDIEVLHWDRTLIKAVPQAVFQGFPLDWKKTIVCGHSSPDPFIHEKFMMLDAGSPRRLMAVELNSMEAFMAYPDNDRLVKYELKEGFQDKVIKKPIFRSG